MIWRWFIWAAIVALLTYIFEASDLHIGLSLLLAVIVATVCTFGDIILIAVVGLLSND